MALGERQVELDRYARWLHENEQDLQKWIGGLLIFQVVAHFALEEGAETSGDQPEADTATTS